MESEFPSNSKEPKEDAAKKAKAPADKKIEKVIAGSVIRRKKPLGKRFLETFTGDDSKSVVNYVTFDVALPALKDLIADMVSQGIERKLFGEARSASRRGRGYSPGHTAYNRMNSAVTRDIFRREDPRAPAPTRRGRSHYNFDDIVLETRAEAIEVIDQMFTILSQYEVVTVADLYESLDTTADFTDQKYGWTDLRGSDVARVRDGYLLDLPKPQQLD